MIRDEPLIANPTVLSWAVFACIFGPPAEGDGDEVSAGPPRPARRGREVIAEGATRNAPAFSRFLRVAALCNGTIVNFTNVANDAQVARTTVYEYFGILQDTLVLYELPAWRKTTTRKPLASSKYYFFDVGVVAALPGGPVERRLSMSASAIGRRSGRAEAVA